MPRDSTWSFTGSQRPAVQSISVTRKRLNYVKVYANDKSKNLIILCMLPIIYVLCQDSFHVPETGLSISYLSLIDPQVANLGRLLTPRD